MRVSMVDASTGAELREAGASLGLATGEGDWCKIDKILRLLEEYRTALNLTGSGALLDHAVEAIVAVAAAERAVGGGVRWLDVGSGGGFPGLIAAVLWAGPVVLTEPRARRAAFLEFAVASVGVGAAVRRVRVEHGESRVLDGRPPLGHDFGVASARAVFAPEAWLAEAGHWLRADGVCLVHQRSSDRRPVDLGEIRGEASARGWRVLAVVPRETEAGA